MTWSGDFEFGDAWAVYRGPVGDNALHAHAALQVVSCDEGVVAIEDVEGAVIRASTVLVRPMAIHRLRAAEFVTAIYIEAQSPVAAALLARFSPGQTHLRISQPDDLSANPAMDPQAWLREIAAAHSPTERALDPRLAVALAFLSEGTSPAIVAEAARHAGLSESRLRTLARETLGLPLSTWVLWRKLERASRALAAGEGLGEAAVSGGFADQAHFTRTMRRMFGVTPGMAGKALRSK